MFRVSGRKACGKPHTDEGGKGTAGGEANIDAAHDNGVRSSRMQTHPTIRAPLPHGENKVGVPRGKRAFIQASASGFPETDLVPESARSRWQKAAGLLPALVQRSRLWSSTTKNRILI